ncbi:ABC transporter substrate-binding protein [Methylocystis parvus]|uniref:ABC transporter substrate-binding protein n=1 Tax=Methylocystis parvus TaxID=134 RepID=A0A6B8M834_9HYPH|nr:ABC transporter substrate-binding protein [Methylocystis parvus]QGM98042.1 ABC transporter substrate-binding protein [Methylocystis parvus]WBK01641.1 ABC transporter substrate-binding protein [Methylocystis parvus OBBP]
MKRPVALLAAAFLFATPASLFATPASAERLRLALQKTGTTGWEMAVVKAFGLDKEAGLELDVTELASPEAGKIAIQGGSADIIVSDWLWVARERAQGARLTLYPYSTGVGAVMTKDASIKGVKDLAGKRLGVAGGPLDKSWLMLKAFAAKQGVDLEKSATILYGAPPLIAEKALQGELDAALEFWNFAADLEARGFARPIEIADVEKALGAKGDAVVTGYVFDDGFAAKNKEALSRFFAMTAKAKTLLAKDDKAWAAAAQRIGARDAATLDVYRKRYVAGIPKRTVAQEAADAAALYKALAKIGGEKLVGPGKTLDPGTFYQSEADGH